MFCSNCGKEIEDGASFCGNCGRSIATEQYVAGSVTKKKPNVKLPVILGICAVAIILIVVSIAVLGKKDIDATNNKVTDSSSVKVTKKLEKEYVARIEAYQEYYEQVRSDYSNYVIGGMVTLDSEGLPILWLGLSEDGSTDNSRTQLVGYENDEAVIWAERSEYIIPFRSSQLILAVGDTDGDEDNYYLYDDEKKDFRLINNELDDLYNNETVYSEKELEETMDFFVPVLEGMSFYKSMQIAVNESAHQVAYLGKTNEDMSCEALDWMNVIEGMTSDLDYIEKYYLRKEYADNKVALRYFEKLADADLDDRTREALLKKYGSETGSDIIKAPNELFITATGSVVSIEEYENSMDIMESAGWEIRGMEDAYFKEAEFGQLLRGLANNPLYSEEELYLYIASIAFNYEIVDIDVESYSLLDASDSYIRKVVKSYICFLQPLIPQKCRMFSKKLQREIPHFCISLRRRFYTEEMSLQTYYC